jgi:hypothetical protein
LNRRPIAFALVVVVLLIGIAMFSAPASSTGFTIKDAVDASMKDAQKFASDNYPGSETYLEVASSSNLTGKWEITMYLTIQPHSRCPAMQKLYYELFPLTLRNETVVAANDCHIRPVSFAPDAIADSYAASPGARQAHSSGYLACAFRLPIVDTAKAVSYCPSADLAAIQDFSSKNSLGSGNWVVQWYKDASDSFLVGLDSSGAAVAQDSYACIQ